ncbi:MAG: hypothetical protein ACRDGJ_06455 [Candidatus Limnocylindria bacterium]
MHLRSVAGDHSDAAIRGFALGSLAAHTCCVVLGLWCLGAGAADPLVVPNAGSRSRATPLTRTELRDIFFVRHTKWPNGDPIRVFVLPDRHPLHVRFSKEVLGVYPYQLRSTWDRILYSGTGVPPTVVNTPQEVRERVDETPGAIGYAEE